VWSTDWWFEPEHELQRIVTAFEAAVRDTRVRTLPQLGRGESEDALVRDSLFSVEPEDMSTGLTSPMRLDEVSAVGGVYEPLRVDALSGAPADLHNPHYARLIREQIHQVIDAEAPITVELLMRRVAEFWGTARLTRRTIARLRQLLEASGAIIRQEHAQLVCWRPDQEPTAYRAFRRPGVERAVEHIPIAEVANCIEYLLGAHVRIDRSALVGETSRLFGLARAGPSMRHTIDIGVDVLVRTDRARVEGDLVCMPDRVAY
jgi:hypothetical protein